MSKQQFNVNLAFSAETGKAKQQIQELQTLLSKIAYQGTTVSSTDQLSTDLRQASEAAKELQFHLNNAFNATTGNFDLSLLDKSLKTSNSNITDLSAKLLNAGQTGQQAFLKLAQSISMADQPMFKINNKLKELGVSLKNAARWQISSNIIHGLQGGIQSAYNYAQDLNKSLNNIRIVTGYNVDKMAEFAEQANKAAKALSTTTTEYTDASLIYFQQGLTDAEVQGRTDTTIKLANVTGQSVEETANQMTAIWNNFDDGSKSLEYYADVITALGAATASSSKEISEGLNKFSAVAESVGLSYEYASAALATVTATTRQSADIVGNAFKTLFARIQGLNLGETLDDGTTLNKYSEALFKVGINIKDQSGQLKDMNTILDEMGNKWSTLDKDQQISLAQTVAGVRQYTQLIALMDNWDYFQQNLGVATDSEGALQKQADIYAESWEAAEKRVQAAAEGIFQSLLDDKFFISINNGFANLLNGLNTFIENAGGMKTLLIGIGGIISSMFANKIPQALDNFKYNLEIVTKGTESAYKRIQDQMNEATQTAFNEYETSKGKKGIKEDSSVGYAIQQANELTVARNKLAMVSDKMSDSEKQLADMSLSIIQARQEEVISLKQKNEAMQESIELQKKEISSVNIGDKISEQSSKVLLDDTVKDLQGQQKFYEDSSKRRGGKQKVYTSEAKSYSEALEEIKNFSDQFDARKEEIRTSYDELHQIIFKGFQEFQSGNTVNAITSEQLFGELDFSDGASEAKNAIEGMIQSIEVLRTTATDTNKDTILEAMRDEVKALSSTIPGAIQKATGLKKIFDKIASKSSVQSFEQMEEAIEDLKKGLKDAKIEGKDFEDILKGFHGNKITNLSQAMETLKNNESDVAEKTSALQLLLNNFNPGHIVQLSEAFHGLTGFLGSAISVGMSLGSIITSLGDPDLSNWEKLSSVITGAITIIPSAKAAFEGLNTAIQGGSQWLSTQNLLLGASTGALGANAAAIDKKTMAEISSYIATQKATGALEDDIIASVTAKLMAKDLSDTDAKAAATKIVHAGATEFLTGALGKLGDALIWVKSNMLLLTIAVIALVAVYNLIKNAINGYNEKVAENAKLIKENAEASKEQADSTQELTESYQAALNNYNKVKQAFEEGSATSEELTTAQDSLADSADKVALALDIEGAALARLSGNYEELTEKIIEQQKAKLETAIIDQQQVKATSGTEFISNMRKDLGHFSGGKYTATFAGGSAVNDAFFDNVDYSQFKYLHKRGHGGQKGQGFYLQSGQDTESMIGAYEEAQSLYQQALTTMSQDQMNKSEVFQDLKEFVQKSQESYEAYKAAEENIKQFEIQKESLSTFEGINTSNISSIQDYETYAKNLIESIASSRGITDQNSQEWKDLTNSVYAYLGALEGVSEFATQSKAFDEISEKTGLAKETLLNYYEALDTEEEKELFFKISFNRVSGADAEEDLTREIEFLQTLADEQTIQVKLDVVSEGLELFNKDATTEEITAWAKKMKEAYGEAFNLDEFLNKSTNEQEEYLKNLQGQAELEKTGNREAQIVEYQEAIKRAQESQTNLETDVGNAKTSNEEKSRYLKQLQQIKNDYNKAISEGEVYDFSKNELGVTDITDLNNRIQATEEIISSNNDIINSYDELETEISEYEQAIEDLEIEKQIEEAYGWRDALKEEADAVGISYDEVQDYAEYLRKTVDELEGNVEASESLALANKKLNKGIKDLADNWDDWSESLKKQKEDPEAYAKALNGIRDSLENVFEIEVSDEFITENLENIQKLASGDLTVLDELQKAMAADYIANIDVEGDAEAQIKLQNILAQIQETDLENIEIGTSVEDAPFYDALNQMLTSGQLTADEVNGILSTIGYDPDIEMVTLPFNQADYTQASNGYTYEYTDPITGESQTIHVTNDQFNQATSGTAVQVPRINAAKTVYKGSAGGGGISKPTPPSSGGGGGGSTPKHAEKKNDSDKTRYHTLQNQLEDLQSEYNSVSEAKDRAFGKDKLNNIDKEIQKTDELINKQKEYIDAISADLPVDKAVMDAYYKDLIGGTIQYDERGNISNYDQIQDAMFAKYNQMADLYDEDSEEWQVFEKKYEQLEKYIEQYEETYDLLRDEEETYQELLRQRMDLQLEKIQYAIELKLNIAEDGLAVLDYQMSRIEDNAFKAAEAIGLFSKKAELLYDQMAADREGLNDILGQQLSQAEIIQFYNGDMSVLEGKTFTEAQMDAIKEYRDNLLELNEEFDDIRENIEEQVMEVFDAWNEKLEQGIDKLDHYGNVLESYKNIIDIVGKDTLGLSDAFMATLNQSSINNAIDKITATKKSYEAMIDVQTQAEQALEEAKARNDEASIKMWEENLQSITEEAQSAREEMLSAWEDALNGIAEQFEATVERVVDTFNKEVYTLGGLEGLSEDFSRQQENADIMLDDYQKIYELSKLNRDINKSIDNIDSISGKQKLKKLLEQINKLQEDGVKMSQYDLEYMQKTYDLRMAEIELEEAQRAKNTVRLRKDNEGNWSYVYTQNMDAVDTAQQKYEDALYAMQDVSSNYIDEMSEKLISTSQEMEEALAAIRIQDYANIDDYYAEVQRVQKQYEDELVVQQGELQKAIDNNKILYDKDWTNYHNATGYKISDTQNFATSFRDTLLGSLMGSEEDTANFTNIMSSAVDTLTQGLMQGAEVYYANLQEAMNAAGTSTEDFAKDFEEKIKEIEDKSEESTNKIKDLAKDMSSSLKEITDSVTTWQKTYGEVMQQIVNSNIAVINSFNDMLKALSIDTKSITVKYDILNDADKEPEQYASGGYTGKWGNYGKLAILDEKELILNKDDTVNFLDALGIAKQILDTIDLNALQASYGFGNLVPATINENNSQTIEQDVHITAEFPNATNHNEIEQAFETLINKASQYANRK